MKIKQILIILIVVTTPLTLYNQNFLPSENQYPLTIISPQSSDATNSSELYSLIIGIADYPGINNDLQYSDTDAYFLENKLLNEYLCDPDKTTFLHNNLATQEAILDALDNISTSIDDNDRFLFYYSGRGLVDDPWSENFSINIETPHNYEDNSHLYWHINHTNATGIRVHYSQFVTEDTSDFVQLGNISEVITQNNQEFYAGAYPTDFWSGYIPGDNLTIYFHSDSQNNGYGFQIDKYQILNESSNSQGLCPYRYFENNSLFINETTLAQKIDAISCDTQYIILDSSFSGGIISAIEAPNRVILTSTDDHEFNIENEDSLAGCLTGYFRQYMNNLNSADDNNNNATSIEEIFNSSRIDAHIKSLDIGFEINPQFYDGDMGNETYLYPAFTLDYIIIGTAFQYHINIDGIHRVHNINIVLFTESDNSFGNYSCTIRPDSGYGLYNGVIEHFKSIDSLGILVQIFNLDNSLIRLHRDDNHDSDNDTLSDILEFTHFTNAMSNDTDSDGLIDPDEFSEGTDPLDNDTDNDSLPDGYEIFHSFNPNYRFDNTSDPDGDNLLTVWEYHNETDPHNPDSDYDGMEDGWEVEFGLLPLDDSDNVTDTDFDLLWNIYEFQNNTNPLSNDTDLDELTDYWELLNSTDPNLNDTDGDQLLDGEEILVYNTNATLYDSDDDFLSDYTELMESNTDPNDNDTDNDGLTDYIEYEIFESNPRNPDSDEDKLTDDLEWEYHTDPWDEDTDDDGYSDYIEVKYHSDPLDPRDFPDGFLIFPILGAIFLTGGVIVFIRYQRSHSYRFIHKTRDTFKQLFKNIRNIPETIKIKRENRKKPKGTPIKREKKNGSK